MFAAVRASRAIKRSSGRRKGRGKLLHSSTFYGPIYQTSPIYQAVATDPQIQTSRVQDDDYTHIVPWNSNTRAGGASHTYLFQFILEGLPLAIPPATGIKVPNGMLKFHSTNGTYGSAWHDMPNEYVLYNQEEKRNGRFRRVLKNYGYFRWMLYCASGSTVQQAKYRLTAEHYHMTGSGSFGVRYIAASLANFQSHLKHSSDTTLRQILGNYSNRGYSAAPFTQGHNIWSAGNYNVGQGYTIFAPYGYQLNLEMLNNPGKYLEWRRQ